MRNPDQLPLPIFPPLRYLEAEFDVAPSNAAAFAWLGRTEEWPDRRLALWGDAGRGKTHLLHIWAARTGAALWSGTDLASFPDLPPAGVALDDADQVADEATLFHLLNAAHEAGLAVLLAARSAPSRWPVRLPDLASRLRAVTAVEIRPLEDALLRTLLERLLLQRRHFYDLEPVYEWLLRRLPRSGTAVGEAVARLDAASLGQHRRITVALAAATLKDQPIEDEISATPADHSRDGSAHV